MLNKERGVEALGEKLDVPDALSDTTQKRHNQGKTVANLYSLVERGDGGSLRIAAAPMRGNIRSMLFVMRMHKE